MNISTASHISAWILALTWYVFTFSPDTDFESFFFAKVNPDTDISPAPDPPPAPPGTWEFGAAGGGRKGGLVQQVAAGDHRPQLRPHTCRTTHLYAAETVQTDALHPSLTYNAWTLSEIYV